MSRKDYRYVSGIVGQYGGQDVFVLPEKDFDLARSKQEKDLIFALTAMDNEQIKLVNRGMLIGYMDPYGSVEMLRKSEFYTSPKTKIEFEDDIIKEASSASGKTIDDYLAGETLVDRFLRGLKF